MKTLDAPRDFIQGQAVNGIWKQELLKYLAELFNLRIFVETGTCEASTLLAVHSYFDKCYSIELSDYYYARALARVLKSKGADHIELHKGNSAIKLKEILNKMSKYDRILFWLDAHTSGGQTANEGDPLPEEIRAIMELSPNSLIIIDDQQNDELCQVVEAGIDFTGWTKFYRNAIVFLYKNGNYNIPEFT